MEEYAWVRRARAEERASGGSRVGPHRDQFLTSAMLCVGAVSVCIVSVMIAGGLAFVGLSDNAAMRTSGMDFVRNGADAWTAPAPIARGRGRWRRGQRAVHAVAERETIAVRQQRTVRLFRATG